MKKAVTLRFKSLSELMQFKQDLKLYKCGILPPYILNCHLTEAEIHAASFYGAQVIASAESRQVSVNAGD